MRKRRAKKNVEGLRQATMYLVFKICHHQTFLTICSDGTRLDNKRKQARRSASNHSSGRRSSSPALGRFPGRCGMWHRNRAHSPVHERGGSQRGDGVGAHHVQRVVEGGDETGDGVARRPARSRREAPSRSPPPPPRRRVPPPPPWPPRPGWPPPSPAAWSRRRRRDDDFLAPHAARRARCPTSSRSRGTVPADARSAGHRAFRLRLSSSVPFA